MKRSEINFLQAFDKNLGLSLSFEAVAPSYLSAKEQPSRKKLHLIAGMVASFCVIMAILLPSVLLLRPSGRATFDDKNITLDSLRERGCLFYEDLVFLQDEKNHVFVTNGEEIVAHYAYEKAVYSETSFSRACNTRLIDAVENIGIPSYAGLSGELSLDYSFNDGYLRRVHLSKKGGELYVESVELLNKEDPRTWFDPEKTTLPFRAECEKIAVGMSLDEVVFHIGKPQRDVGSGACIFQFDLEGGGALELLLTLDVEKENEYVHDNPESAVYGSHCLYVASVNVVPDG